MRRILILFATVLVLGLATSSAMAITESDTGTEYPDLITLDCAGESLTLAATGVGLREKTFLKVDVYTIVSYVKEGVDLGDDSTALVTLDVPKQLRMDLRRGFSKEKLINSFSEVIEKNYDDTSAFAADLDIFFAYFERDAEEDDILVFDYCPGTGLTTTLNGEVKGVIANPSMAEALWTVWFGKDPANKGLRKDMLSAGGE